MNTSKTLYLGPLDGLRLLAFLCVFIHHLPALQSSEALTTVHRYGWVGVELFFVISSFLLFRLFSAETEKAGRLNIKYFYARRLLRLYPLMVAFPALMLVLYGSGDGLGLLRLVGVAIFGDNLLAWHYGYNTSIAHSSHLWTLSFEFQVYALLPFGFLLLRRNSQVFWLMVAAWAIFALLARMALFSTPHPAVWVTPFLRPESILLGISLAVLRPTWHWAYSAATFVILVGVFISSPMPWETRMGAVYVYPIAALMCATLVDASLRSPSLQQVLSWRPIRYLGKISFGLYVFHFWAMGLAGEMISTAGVVFDGSVRNYILYAGTSFVTVISLASASYYLLERPIDRLRKRFTVVDGRQEDPDKGQAAIKSFPVTVKQQGA